eukprot:TRINITY_DN26725_c0_g1_i1.p2 TRINITY_DN26725_c0_g1~~TRINITY_DN26725_c0_g1_i1.p2  ORF type:complete len:124 (+),score=2.72 TRINITY_DN26725_c0_g1_i1:140-511(+)
MVESSIPECAHRWVRRSRIAIRVLCFGEKEEQTGFFGISGVPSCSAEEKEVLQRRRSIIDVYEKVGHVQATSVVEADVHCAAREFYWVVPCSVLGVPGLWLRGLLWWAVGVDLFGDLDHLRLT